MPFDLTFPTPQGDTRIHLDEGEVLFVLGANGTGKSSLMFHLGKQHHDRTRRISAHRQTWLPSDVLDMTPSARAQTERHIFSQDQQTHSRYRDDYAAQRTSITIYDLIQAENARAREIASALDARDCGRLKQAGEVESSISTINELLQQANMPIAIAIGENEQVTASKNSSPDYSAAQLSDGERNALLIAASVLTAPAGTLLAIDEPERHLHRSIISPLLARLFERREDCSFLISTHDPDLVLAHPEARSLLLRSCEVKDPSRFCWDVDELPAGSAIDESLKRDLLGARRIVLFVEGTQSSLDRALYSIVFPMASVVPKGNCRAVAEAVAGARSAERFHWLRAFGIVDSDGIEQASAARPEQGIYVVPYYSVEAVYFHPEIVRRVASSVATLHGGNAEALAEAAVAAGVEAVRGHTERLSRNAAKKMARRLLMDRIPSDDELLDSRGQVVIGKHSNDIHAECTERLEAAVERNDWEAILRSCPVRKSKAPERIARTLRFGGRQDYENAVRHLLHKDEGARLWVRGLFGDLGACLGKDI